MDMIKYSIIIPVYNCEEYLVECISSIICQKKYNDEIILVNDGSTDQSVDICNQFSKEYDQIRVFHKHNGGAASARNLGIKEAKGEFILFVDGDDTIEPDLLDKITLNDSDLMIYGMSFDYYKGNHYLRSEILSCEDCGTVSDIQLRDMFTNLFYDNVFSSACNKVFRRNIIIENKLLFDEEMTLYEDLDFVLRYISFCRTYSFVNKPLYHYRLEVDNLHLKARLSNISAVYKNMQKALNSFEDYALGDNKIHSIGTNLYLQLLYQHMINFKWQNKSIINYCESPVFNRMLEIDKLKPNEKKLYNRIQDRDFSAIHRDIVFKKIKKLIRQTIKRLIKKD